MRMGLGGRLIGWILIYSVLMSDASYAMHRSCEDRRDRDLEAAGLLAPTAPSSKERFAISPPGAIKSFLNHSGARASSAKHPQRVNSHALSATAATSAQVHHFQPPGIDQETAETLDLGHSERQRPNAKPQDTASQQY